MDFLMADVLKYSKALQSAGISVLLKPYLLTVWAFL